MDNTDKKQFAELICGLHEYYGKDKPSKMQLLINFNALSRFSFEDLSNAAGQIVQKSKFLPRAADFIEILEGGEITADEIIGMAKLANTPLGIMARIHIGTWDLERGDFFYLKSRANEVLLLLPEWRERAISGGYTDHEISIMLKHSVNPASPFAKGIAPPESSQALLARASDIAGTDRHIKLIAIEENHENTDDDKSATAHESVQEFLKNIIEGE